MTWRAASGARPRIAAKLSLFWILVCFADIISIELKKNVNSTNWYENDSYGQ
jgi:hypothetical protein